MYTSVFAIALAGFLASHSSLARSPEPEWWRDYAAAQEKGRQEKKPLAVFVGSGYDGFEQVANEGRLSDSIKATLAHSYVCVYLDARTRSGSAMIRSLDIRDTGLVISDRSGRFQAFHHSGTLAQTELANQLDFYAHLDTPIRSTVTNSAVRTSYYPTYSPPVMTRSC